MTVAPAATETFSVQMNTAIASLQNSIVYIDSDDGNGDEVHSNRYIKAEWNAVALIGSLYLFWNYPI